MYMYLQIQCLNFSEIRVVKFSSFGSLRIAGSTAPLAVQPAIVCPIRAGRFGQGAAFLLIVDHDELPIFISAPLSSSISIVLFFVTLLRQAHP
jgi:hypothetical protein